MKKEKKILTTLLAGSMVAALVGCGGPSNEAGSTAEMGEEGNYTQLTYAYATFNNIPTEENLDVVEEAINEITREKIGAEITLKPISIAEYSSTVSLALQGGEKIDIFQSLGDFNTCVSQDMAYDLTELVDTHGAETKELIGEEWLAACSIDGQLYGVPTYKPIALTPMLIYRQDIADELGLDIASIDSEEEVTAILEEVEAAYPDMTPLAPVMQGQIGLHVCFEETDYLGDDRYSPKGVLQDGEMQVLDLYSSEEFADACDIARTWYENDLVMKDAATTSSTATECMSSGNYFGCIAAYSYPEEDTAVMLETQSGGADLGARIIGDAYISTADVNALTWMVASTTDEPETAMEFLNMTFTDSDIINLLIYGIEGRDYVLDEEGMMSYPEGEDATTVPYTAQLSHGTLGNFFEMYQSAGSNPDSLEWELEQNKNALVSPAMGFTFDSSSLKTQYTAVSNVISQYLPGLLCGNVDPDSEIPKFVEALNNAGYQDILAEKQKQLDEWAE